MAWRRASFASLAALRSSAVMRPLVAGAVDSGVVDSSVHWGQRLAKPGLSGLSSNSSLQMAQSLTGKGISTPMMILNHGWLDFLGRSVESRWRLKLYGNGLGSWPGGWLAKNAVDK